LKKKKKWVEAAAAVEMVSAFTSLLGIFWTLSFPALDHGGDAAKATNGERKALKSFSPPQ
jgi:hypothetical protein